MVAPAQHHHALAGKSLVDLSGDQVHRAQISCENDDLFARILAPERPQSIQKLLRLRFALLRVRPEKIVDPHALFRQVQIDRDHRRCMRLEAEPGSARALRAAIDSTQDSLRA